MENIEIEIRVKIKSSSDLLNKWLKYNATHISTEEQEDIYYEPKNNSYFYLDHKGKPQANKWLRIRKQDKQGFLCFKEAHRNKIGEFIYADEFEVTVDNTHTLHKILSNLDYKKLCSVFKKRSLWKFSNYYICIDHVKNLGDFVEIELINQNKDRNIESQKKAMVLFVQQISSSEVEEIKEGYPWLIINKDIYEH